VPTRFDRDTSLTRLDQSAFEARMDTGWWIIRGPNGGYVGAILLRALTEVVDGPERCARSFTVHFTAPPAEGPVRIDTTVERTGRSLTTVSGRMWQGERLCAVGLAAFSKSRKAVEFQDARMPEVIPAARAEPLAPERKDHVPMRERYEQREVSSPTAFEYGVPGAGGGWTRLAEPRVADALLVTALSDCWPPAVWHRTHPDGANLVQGVPTVDLTVHFRTALPLPDARPDDFYLTLFRSSTARDGFIEEDGEIWSPSGLLVAQSRQHGLLL
jgi:acyl-CoA thioesterase